MKLGLIKVQEITSTLRYPDTSISRPIAVTCPFTSHVNQALRSSHSLVEAEAGEDSEERKLLTDACLVSG
jgi:hypothetical protein